MPDTNFDRSEKLGLATEAVLEVKGALERLKEQLSSESGEIVDGKLKALESAAGLTGKLLELLESISSRPAPHL